MPLTSRKFRLLFTTAVFVFTGTAVFLTWTLFRTVEESVQPVVVDTRVRRAIDGILVDPSDATSRSVGVLIDGMVDGRPTAGLSAAPLVWELPVEGGITRFLAVYPSDALPEKVGPIRSLRPYVLDFASEVGALLMHVGGSPEALTRARTFPLERLNQFFDDRFFWRSTDRRAPHNVFTSQYLVTSAFTERKYARESVFTPWRYQNESVVNADGNGVRVAYSTSSYTVEWRWNGSRYERFMGGVRHQDEDGAAIDAKNVLVQFTSIEILDAIGRRRITTEGEGKALVLTAGSTHEATWKKIVGDRTRFYYAIPEYPATAGMKGNRCKDTVGGADSDHNAPAQIPCGSPQGRVHDTLTGEEVALQPGTTWIEVVPNNGDVTIVQSQITEDIKN
ncbi:MAG: DUF3048 domain-containing protein [bacterium]|nr:DUF3048 domain-containing protein [bacterium]